MGVTLSIFVIAVLMSRRFPAKRDPAPPSAGGHVARSVDVRVEAPLWTVPGWRDQAITMSYLVREGRGSVVADNATLLPGDHVLVIGTPDAADEAMAFLGDELREALTDDRTDVDHRRFVVSNQDVAGRTVADLDLPRRHGGRATRVYRGDTELLARDDLVLQLGDRVLAVFPKGRLEVGASVFGDSERRVSEIDALTLAVGLALGLLLGIIPIPVGDTTLRLGAAAGPLIVGLILGRLVRTGPSWTLPNSGQPHPPPAGSDAVPRLRRAGVGPGVRIDGADPDRPQGRPPRRGRDTGGLRLRRVAGRVLQLSVQRTAGIGAASSGQPAILAFAQSKSADPASSRRTPRCLRSAPS